MANPLLNEAAHLVRLLESSQSAMLALLARKRDALQRSDAATLLAMAKPEADLLEQTRLILGHRARLLKRAAAAGLPGESLEALAGHFDTVGSAELVSRIDRVRKLAGDVQRENRIQWIIARSSLMACEGILEVVARRGQKRVTMHEGHRPAGALVDSSV